VGILLSGAGGNVIQGNFIGTNPAGTAALGNSLGLSVTGASSNNTIGGTTPAARNVISGNTVNGGIGFSNASGNTVQGNYIGTNAAGTAALGNSGNGLNIASASNNTIGGTVAGAGNVVSGNSGVGIFIDNSTGTLVQGNLVGTNATGTAAIGNSPGGGIVVNASSGNTIGGTSAAARNVSSGNSDGIRIDNGSNNNTVQGNFSGTDVTGTIAIPNLNFGVIIMGGSNNLIGGTSAAARNVLSGNAFSGINLFTSAAANNTVQGNFIGVDSTGATALPNATSGFRINGGVNNTIGGTLAAAANIVSGNPVGFTFLNSGNGNTVQGNFIGTLANGITPMPNTGAGISIDTGSSNNTIGGVAAGAANTIAFNGGVGVNVISGTGNAVLSNAIFSNGGLGIDLGSDGVTANDTCDPDAGANNLQNFPALFQAAVDTQTIEGNLDSAGGSYTIEFFNNGPSGCDSFGFGEGKQAIVSFSTPLTSRAGTSSRSIPFGTQLTISSGWATVSAEANSRVLTMILAAAGNTIRSRQRSTNRSLRTNQSAGAFISWISDHGSRMSIQYGTSPPIVAAKPAK